MRGVRVRWGSAVKVAAIAVGALLALQALPALLKPPEPPPRAPDVGLPRVVPVQGAPKPAPRKQWFQPDDIRPKGTMEGPREEDPAKARFQTDEIRPKGTTKSRHRHPKPPAPPEP